MISDSLDSAELLRWWHQHHVQVLSREADCIRNELLQEIFAARRRLELVCQACHSDEQTNCHTCLDNLEQLYGQLENLGDRLFSPYADSNLPLALQQALQPWRSRLTLEMLFPSKWPDEPIETAQLLILLLSNVFQGLTSLSLLPSHCHLMLKAEPEVKEMTITASYDTALPSIDTSSELRLLKYPLETFRLLTHGSYIQQHDTRQLCWRLSWNH